MRNVSGPATDLRSFGSPVLCGIFPGRRNPKLGLVGPATRLSRTLPAARRAFKSRSVCQYLSVDPAVFLKLKRRSVRPLPRSRPRLFRQRLRQWSFRS